MIINDLNFGKSYGINRNSDRKTLYMKVDQKNTTNNNTLFVCLTNPPNAPNIDTPPPVRLAIILGTDESCPDRKTLYTKVAQNESTNTYTIPIHSPHPSNIPIIEPPPLRTVCPINGPVLLECPDEFIPNTNVSQNRSISTDTPPLHLSGTPDTPCLPSPPPPPLFPPPPPPDPLSGSHPGAGNSSADEFPLRAQIIVLR